MKTCPYCGSEVQLQVQFFYYCSFCQIKLKKEDVQENGERKSLLPQEQPSIEDVKKSTTELMKLTTLELLWLLKLARKERAEIYNNRFIFIQALKQGATKFEEAEKYTYQQYEYITRKCFVLENIIRERIGYIPPKISQKYITNLIEKLQLPTKKMIIQKTLEKEKEGIK